MLSVQSSSRSGLAISFPASSVLLRHRAVAPGRKPQGGEAGFLIAHAELGVLVLEVRGGRLTHDPPTRTWQRARPDAPEGFARAGRRAA